MFVWMVDPARRVERAMREAKFCAECNDSIPRAGRHAVPNIGIFVCNRCYGVFREGVSSAGPAFQRRIHPQQLLLV